jgi:hypothetical protein
MISLGRPGLALPFALLVSIAVHVGGLWGLRQLDFTLDVDFEFELPAEVELGVTEELAVAAPPPTPPPAPAAAPVEPPSEPGEGPGERAEDPPEPPPPVDAGVPEPPQPPPVDAGRPLVAQTSSVDGPSRLPPGAQLAMRIDMRRIGDSPLAPAVRDFFRRVPDWYLLLHGSEIDPVEDLDRLFIATPDPRRRSKLVIAGRVRGGEMEMRYAVGRMAAARGEPAPWRRLQGLPVADWRNLDETARVMALLGPRQFAIAREEDLPTLLAMMAARAEHGRDEGLEPAEGADALLSMGEEDALSLEVEGIHTYVRGRTEHMPTRARVAIREAGPARIEVEGLAFFPSEDEAAAALPYWDALRQQVARHPAARLFGFSSIFDLATLSVEGDRIRIRTQLSHGQARMVLNQIAAQIAAMTGWQPPPEPSATPPSNGESPSTGESTSAPAGAAPPAPALDPQTPKGAHP